MVAAKWAGLEVKKKVKLERKDKKINVCVNVGVSIGKYCKCWRWYIGVIGVVSPSVANSVGVGVYAAAV